jgi:DNA-binding PadR family transcriptional regulator
MHGYEMILEIRERSAEAWSPSPGAIYPTIQLLTDEGLITTQDQEGKKVSSLTDAGRTLAQELASTRSAPWDDASNDAGEAAPNLRQAIHHLLMAVKQVATAGTESQRQRATELLDETRRKIYALLASDET